MLKPSSFILIGFFFSTLSLLALVIDPPGIKLSGLPGETIEGYITLTNEKLTLIELEVVHRDNSLAAKDFPGWLNLWPEKMSLESQEKRQLYYKVHIPEEAKGQFLSIISFEEKSNNNAQMFNTRARISIYLAATVEGTEMYSGEIQSLKFNPNRPTVLNVLLENTGNVYVKSEGLCKIKDISTGSTVAEFSVNPRMAPVYAGKSRNLIGKMDSPLEPGDYEMTVVFPFPDEAHLISKTVSLRIVDEHTLDAGQKEILQ